MMCQNVESDSERILLCILGFTVEINYQLTVNLSESYLQYTTFIVNVPSLCLQLSLLQFSKTLTVCT